jgi:hypothetical protein
VRAVVVVVGEVVVEVTLKGGHLRHERAGERGPPALLEDGGQPRRAALPPLRRLAPPRRRRARQGRLEARADDLRQWIGVPRPRLPPGRRAPRRRTPPHSCWQPTPNGHVERLQLAAVEQRWPASDCQHCAVHRLRNLLAELPKRERERVRQAYWQALDDGHRRARRQAAIPGPGRAARQGLLHRRRQMPRRRPRRARRPPTLPDEAYNVGGPTNPRTSRWCGASWSWPVAVSR